MCHSRRASQSPCRSRSARTSSARRLAAWWLSTYATRMGPIYPRLLQRFSSAQTVKALPAAAQELPVMADELAREVTLFGTYDEGPS